jgi:large subunit ribosomal protein L11
MKGDVVPAEITIYEDRTFTFILKTPPASALLKQAAGIEKGAANPLTGKVGKVTRADIRKIAERKLPDLNTDNLEAAERIIMGTAKNMGITVEG